MSNLIYLTIRRLNIFYTVGGVSKYMQHPWQRYFDIVLQILRYIIKTIDYRILYTNNSSIRLVNFIDMEYASDVDTCRSIASYFFSLAYDIISWCSKG